MPGKKTERKRIIAISFAGILLVLCILVITKTCKIEPYENYPSENVVLDTNNTKYFHISIDDSNSIFEDLTNNADLYNSIFDQPTLSYVKELHDKYGVKISFYVFYSWAVSKDGFTLSKATDRYQSEFSNNADWLKFGFHAKDASAYEAINDKEEYVYYTKTIRELRRIVGDNSIDYFVRLDRYVADKNVVKVLHDNGIVGLLIADDQSRSSYSLSQDETEKCYDDDWYEDDLGMKYTPTDIRVESIENDDQFYASLDFINKQKRIEIFTHEWKLEDMSVKKYLSWYSYIANKSGLDFSFSTE